MTVSRPAWRSGVAKAYGFRAIPFTCRAGPSPTRPLGRRPRYRQLLRVRGRATRSASGPACAPGVLWRTPPAPDAVHVQRPTLAGVPQQRRRFPGDAGDGYGQSMGVETAAIAAGVLFGVVALFQLALALGVPWGAFAFGGRAVRDDGTLPPAYRAASAVTAVVLVLFAVVILTRAGVIGTSGDSTLVTVMSWVIVAFMAINTPMNLLGRHWIEKYVFGGITLVLLVLCAIVATSGPN